MSTRHEMDKDALSPSEESVIAAYRAASTDQPAPGIDAAILAAARRSVGARPQPLGRFRWTAWGVPLAAAATVVLSSTVVYWSARDHGVDNLTSPEGPSYREEAKELPRLSAQSQAEADQIPLVPAPAVAPPSTSNVAAPSVNLTQEPAKPKPVDTLDSSNVSTPTSHVADAAIPSAVEPAASRDSARDSDVPVMSPPPTAATVSALPSTEMQSSEQPRAKIEERERAVTLLKDSRSVSQAIGGASSAATPAEPRRGVAEAALEQRVEEIRTLIRDGATQRAMDAIAALRRDHPGFKLPEDVDRFAKDNESISR